MSLETVIAGIGTIEKIVPVIEAVGSEIGPLVQKEVADGKAVWADLTQAWTDFKAAVAAVKAATGATTPANAPSVPPPAAPPK